MAFRYVVKKRVFGFDKSKSEKYVAASFSIGEISYDRLCDQVTKEGMAPRGVVKMVMDGLIDALSTYVSLGATVKLGDFGTIRPGLNCKSQSEAKDATAELPEKKINVEIKSLNSKAMDLSARIAPAYREKEMEIRNEISRTLERGKVDFSLWVEKKESAESATPINQALVEGYYKQIKDIADNLSIPVPTDWFQTLLRMPDVLTKTETQELTEEEWATVHAAVLEAIGHLVDFRKQEGAALEKKFREKIANISRLLESITPYEKERVEKVKERITDALEKTLSVDYDKNRLEQELIYYIEKLDVNEEKQRLGNHLKYFISTMESGSGQGKKLGFIAQEMGREINTLGSKSNHAEMQKIVVQMKDELEQIKEQVLNVM